MNKKFTSKFFLDTFYEVIDEYWLDEDTYVIIFQDMEDKDGDIFHLEVEYHKDEERITYTRVYEFENVEASLFVSKSRLRNTSCSKWECSTKILSSTRRKLRLS